MRVSRRGLLLSGGLGLGAAAVGLSAWQRDRPLADAAFAPADFERLPALDLATSLREEFDYEPSVRGRLPPDLRGVLYRNGPGLFDRAGARKRCLLDGDGMVQAFRLEGGRARYRNRFVRTPKYVAEEAAGRFLSPTWTTQAPGPFWRNLPPGDYPNQAGITVFVRRGRLYAFDEYKPPFELDPVTLETVGESWLGVPPGTTVFSAHGKIDRANGDWVFFGVGYGREARLHLTVLDAEGRLKHHQTAALPRYTYLHDVLVTARHVVVNLHPVELDLFALLSGHRSMAGSLRWREREGNQVLVFRRDGDGSFRRFEAEPAWMWHGLNAYETADGELVADFVGYRFPDHFLGRDPALFAVMEGRRGDFAEPGELRRYRIDLNGNRLREERVSDANHEFPFVNPDRRCHPHRFGYLARASRGRIFYDGLVRFDYASGREDAYTFPPGVYASEPVFVPKPGPVSSADGPEPGWVLSQIHDGNTRRSALAVFDAEQLPAGPIAEVLLHHPVPLGFHGYWADAGGG